MPLLGCLKCLLPTWGSRGKYADVPVSPLEALSVDDHSEAPPMGFIDSVKFTTVVVVPDVHGDLEGAIASVWNAYAVLEREAAVDLKSFSSLFRKYMKNNPPKAKVKPISGLRDVAIVQLGDMVDRGPDSELCVRFFLAIPAVLGWPVWALLGNHEIMSMTIPTKSHNVREKKETRNKYVHPDDWRAYSLMDGRARDRAYGLFPSEGTSVGKCSKSTDRSSGMWSRVVGSSTDCRMYDLLTENMYGVIRWAPFASPAHALAGSAATLFVHAGVVLEWFEALMGKNRGELMDVASINLKIRGLVKTLFDKTQSPSMMDWHSVFYDRWMVSLPTHHLCAALLPAVLRAFDVSRVIVGHTPQDNGKPNSRCDGQVVLADAGMSRWMRTVNQGKPSSKLHPVSVILKSQADGNELKSMETVSNYPPTVESLFDREFFLASAELATASDRIVAGLVFHTRTVATSMERAVREFVVGNSVGVGVHVMSPIATDQDNSPFIRDNKVRIVPDPQLGGWIVFVAHKCMGVASMEIAHIRAELTMEFATHIHNAILSPVAEIFKSAHNQGLLLGLPDGAAVLDSFCVGIGGEVFLADYVGVRIGSPLELSSERARVAMDIHTVVEKLSVFLKGGKNR